MSIINKFLDKSFIPAIHKCWMKSFADYQIDISYLTLDKMVCRAKMDRVDYELSVGAFCNNEMVGFLLIAIDTLDGELCAFDAGTGVVPECRGRGVAGSLFEFALPKLRSVGVKKFLLEVLQNNPSAIRVYMKTGFTIACDYNCYKLDITDCKLKKFDMPYIRVKPISKNEIENYKNFIDWEVSWEYNFSAINSIDDNIIINGAFVNDMCIGFIVYYPTLSWIFMLAVDRNFRNQMIGTLLLSKLLDSTKTNFIKFNNLLPDHCICKFLEKHGFKLYATQYEMVYSLC
jgi:ribosomal protein S18 acetylase RimI-like enzyme